jgi:hypothetical protein
VTEPAGDTLAAGWFIIEGVTQGQRTLEEQMMGLEPALFYASGRAVLDLGTAEGLIAREFIRAGAYVDAVESNTRLVIVPGVPVMYWNLNHGLPPHLSPPYHIVLLLAILHKLRQPAEKLRSYAALATERVVIRLPFGSAGVITRKGHPEDQCDCNEVMQDCGFTLEQTLPGPREELVQHWIRSA